MRNRNYYLIEELGAVLKLPGVNWIVLQYTVTPEEIATAERLFDVRLHLMPGVDLRDDIDQIVALGASLDLMLATPSTIEPLVAATGTSVISLATGYDSVSQYRIGPDGETDRILPNLQHISERRFGSKEDLVREAARRIGAVVRQRLERQVAGG